ncbi:MAG: hypothetical protein ABIO44_03235, partial [Saprospiraceae bacterium]
MNKHFFILVLLLVLQNLSSQSSSDAFRFADSRIFGTARVMGTGGSFGAVGADQSSIGINVAGLGLYRKSDFNLTFNNNSNSGKYLLEGDPSNTRLKDNKNKFDISCLGLVLAKSHPSYSNWTSSNWYIGYNKTASYNQDLIFEG